jgi:hypothetical protein
MAASAYLGLDADKQQEMKNALSEIDYHKMRDNTPEEKERKADLQNELGQIKAWEAKTSFKAMATEFSKDPAKAVRDHPQLHDAKKILETALDFSKQQGLDKKQLKVVEKQMVHRISQAIEKGKVPVIQRQQLKQAELEMER